jgi:hypothetical protein
VLELKGEKQKSPVIIEDFYTHLSTIDWRIWQKQRKNIEKANTTTKHSSWHLQNKCQQQHRHCFWVHMEYILNYKTKHNHFKIIVLRQNMFSDYNGIELEINDRKTTAKSRNTWKLNNILFKNPWMKKRNLKGNKKYIEVKENDNSTP